MALNFGTGFLPTDPRSKRRPTGGSTKAAQPRDTSSVITGNPADSGIGFASPSARAGSGLFAEPYVAPAPENPRLTAAEIRDERASSGVAASHQNMGSLAVDFRASEQARRDAGETTVTEQRATKILDQRSADEHKRTVLDPAAAEASRFRAQAQAAKDMFRSRTYNKPTVSSYGGRSPRDFSVTASRGRIAPAGGSARAGYTDANRAANMMGADHSWVSDQWSKDREAVGANPDLMALAAQRAHGAAPGTQEKDWMAMASGQSAGGIATPSEMAQAAVSMHARRTPNK